MPLFTKAKVTSWSPVQVGQWLEDLGLAHLRESFIKNGVSGEDLLGLTDDDLAVYLHANPLQIRKLRSEITKLAGKPTPLMAKGHKWKKSSHTPAAIPVMVGPPAAGNFQNGVVVAAVPLLSPYHSLSRTVHTMRMALVAVCAFIIVFSVIAFSLHVDSVQKNGDWSTCSTDYFCILGLALTWLSVLAAAILIILQIIIKKKSMPFINSVCIACLSISTASVAVWLLYNSFLTYTMDYPNNTAQVNAQSASEWVVFILWVLALLLSIIQLAHVHRLVHHIQRVVRQPRGAKNAVHNPAYQGTAGQNIPVYNPATQSPDIERPAVQNQIPAVVNPSAQNPAVVNPAVQHQAVYNPAANPALQNQNQAAVYNPAAQTPVAQNQAVYNPAAQTPVAQNQNPAVQHPAMQPHFARNV